MTTKNIDYASLKKLPVNKSCIDEIIEQNYYYVDKTPFIKKLFKLDTSQLVLITRPEHFGKSLAMDTFDKFLRLNPDNPRDTSYQDKIFKDTKIYEDKEFCQEFMGKYPVISISLKDIDADNYSLACWQIAEKISKIAKSFRYILKANVLENYQREDLDGLMNLNESGSDAYLILLCNSLWILSNILYRYYGKQVIILVNEYDAPLAKATLNGYYDEMHSLIYEMFTVGFRRNPALFKVVITGCVRAPSEDIFVALNKIVDYSVANGRGMLDECMGFTQDEVHSLLNYYGLSEYEQDVHNWYGGYRIRRSEIFCASDVISFVNDAINHLKNGNDVLAPKSYWPVSSFTNIIEHLMSQLDERQADGMQNLLDGGEFKFSLKERLHYKNISKRANIEDYLSFILHNGHLASKIEHRIVHQGSHNADDLWSLLLYKGYLTSVHSEDRGEKNTVCTVRIPNQEIKESFKHCIIDYYHNSTTVKENSNEFIAALLDGDCIEADRILGETLKKYVLVSDIATTTIPDNFYHSLLNDIFSCLSTFSDNFKTSAEKGDGYADFVYCSEKPKVGIIIELKSTEIENNIVNTAGDALKHIDINKYASIFAKHHIQKVYCYGIGFYRKDCYMLSESEEL